MTAETCLGGRRVDPRVVARAVCVLLLLLAAAAALAHPGRTAADGCHYCRSNCAKWNVKADARHCHGGSGGSAAPSAQVATCPTGSGETWRGLVVVAPECRCSPYDRDDYDSTRKASRPR